MAHEISITSDGTAEAAFAGEKPWHKLGAQVAERMTAQQALDLAHLRWSVEKRTLWLEDGTDIPDKVAICRGDTGAYLGTVGPDWIPVQNEEQARFVEALAGAGGVVECLGALKGGRRRQVGIELRHAKASRETRPG